MIGKIFLDYRLAAIFKRAFYSNSALCLGRVALDSAEAEASGRLDVDQIAHENLSELFPGQPCSFERFGHLEAASLSRGSFA